MVIDGLMGKVSQSDIDNKALLLLNIILDDAIESDTMLEKVQAITAFSRHKMATNSDPVNLINQLGRLTAKQTKILEASLKKQKLLDEFKSGKISLDDVYKLPKPTNIKKTKAKKKIKINK